MILKQLRRADQGAGGEEERGKHAACNLMHIASCIFSGCMTTAWTFTNKVLCGACGCLMSFATCQSKLLQDLDTNIWESKIGFNGVMHDRETACAACKGPKPSALGRPHVARKWTSHGTHNPYFEDACCLSVGHLLRGAL